MFRGLRTHAFTCIFTGLVGICSAQDGAPALLNANNVFTGEFNSFFGRLGVGVKKPGFTLHLREQNEYETIFGIDAGVNTSQMASILFLDKGIGVWKLGRTGDNDFFLDHSLKNILTVKPSGMVGIGIATPTSMLEVGGIVTMKGFRLGTSSQAGFVLTSDENGFGSWKKPAPVTNDMIVSVDWSKITNKPEGGGGVGTQDSNNWGLLGNVIGAGAWLGTKNNIPLLLRSNTKNALMLRYDLTSGTDSLEGMSIVGGFWQNTAASDAVGSTVFGGLYEHAEGVLPNESYSIGGTISGGAGNIAGTTMTSSASFATIGGGKRNEASALISTVGGGGSNSARGIGATVSGGSGNTAFGEKASIIGGDGNQAGGKWSSILGGFGNFTNAAANYSLAMGFASEANHPYSFIWNSSQSYFPASNRYKTTGPGQFLINATGNVGINTNSPVSTLDVNGEIAAMSLVLRQGAEKNYVLTATGRKGHAKWMPAAAHGNAGGDLSGTYPSPTVVQIQGRPVYDGAPDDQQVLTWSAGRARWQPQSLAISGWGLQGNAGTNPSTNFIGTTDAADFVLKTANVETMRLSRRSTTFGVLEYRGPTILGGLNTNYIGPRAVGAMVFGGVDSKNTSQSNWSIQNNAVYGVGTTISGGASNRAGNQDGTGFDGAFATVSGGQGNNAKGIGSSVTGGNGNFAEGDFSSILGGYGNWARGDNSVSMGVNAQSWHNDSYVWNSNHANTFRSTADGQFLINATGNVGINKPNPATTLDVAGTVTMTGFKLPTSAQPSYVLTSDASGNGTWQPSPSLGAAGGDLSGNYPNPTVIKLLGRELDSTAPNDGQVLKWNQVQNRWIPKDDAGTTYEAGDGLNLTGNVFSVPTDGIIDAMVHDVDWAKITSKPTTFPPSGAAAGDLAGSYPNPTIALGAVINNRIADGAVNDAKISDVNWTKISNKPTSFPPNGVAGGDLSGTYPDPTIGAGKVTNGKIADGAVSNIKISDVDWTKVTNRPTALPPNGTASGDLGGSYPAPDVVKIRGKSISATAPTDKQFLKYNFGASQWESASLSMFGDVIGAFDNTTVSRIQGRSVASTAPAANDVLKWDPASGGSWKPGSVPLTGAAGGDLFGTYPDPTIGAGKVTNGKIADGAVNNVKISDVDWTKVTNRPTALPPSGTAGGDLSGTYPAPSVAKIQGKAISSTAPTDLQFLRYNFGASQWEPTSLSLLGDVTGAYNNTTVSRIQGRSVSSGTPNDNDALLWSDSNNRWQPGTVPLTGTAGGDLAGTYPNPTIGALKVTTGKIADANVTNPKIADGAVSNVKISDVDWTKVTNRPTALPPNGSAGGDLGGSYPSPSVNRIRGTQVSATAPTDLQFLQYSTIFSQWMPTALSLSGDVSGAYSSTTVSRLQGRILASTAPNDGDAVVWSVANNRWQPGAPTLSGSAGGDLTGSYPNPTIGTSKVTNGKIADGAVNNAKISDVDWTKVSNRPTALPPNGAASGDLGGTYPSPSVVKLQGFAVHTTAPTSGQVLAWNQAQLRWEPTTPAVFPGWSITGNSGTSASTNFIGTTDAVPFSIRVENSRAMRYQHAKVFYGPNFIESNNVLGGYDQNQIYAGPVGAVIAGGGFFDSLTSSILKNIVTDDACAVLGGYSNVAGNEDATYTNARGAAVVGGSNNKATAAGSFVGGGLLNFANGAFSVVPGGQDNVATGTHSFAAGFHARADFDGNFVWSDTSSASVFAPKSANQFCVRAVNGFGINTADPFAALHVVGTIGNTLRLDDASTTGTTLQLRNQSTGGSIWSLTNTGTANPIGSERLVFALNSSNLMTLDADGFLGLGTTNPTYPLHVNGHGFVTGNMRANGDVITGSNSSSSARIVFGNSSGEQITSNRNGADPMAYGLEFRTGGSAAIRMFLTNGGHLGIGDTDPTYLLELPNIAGTEGQGRANAWVTYSSKRYKENIKPIDSALDKVLDLRGVMFDWKKQNGGTHDIGFVAEEAGRVVPELVEWERDGKYAKGMKYDRVSALTVEAIKEQQKQIQTLKSENQKLRAEIGEIYQLLKALNKVEKKASRTRQ